MVWKNDTPIFYHKLLLIKNPSLAYDPGYKFQGILPILMKIMVVKTYISSIQMDYVWIPLAFIYIGSQIGLLSFPRGVSLGTLPLEVTRLSDINMGYVTIWVEDFKILRGKFIHGLMSKSISWQNMKNLSRCLCLWRKPKDTLSQATTRYEKDKTNFKVNGAILKMP